MHNLRHRHGSVSGKGCGYFCKRKIAGAGKAMRGGGGTYEHHKKRGAKGSPKTFIIRLSWCYVTTGVGRSWVSGGKKTGPRRRMLDNG